jgi:16S rRNA (adenine1518-N6/adenine1519-N6)-dimethyltransferase
MCQSEAFNRFYDLEGENYGPVSVMLHLLGTPKKLLTVKPGSFYPAPKCNSLVFVFDYEPIVDKAIAISVYKMCKSLFLNRRKTIYNNLKNYSKDVELVEKVLKKLNIEPNRRPDTISPTEYLKMYQLFTNKNV